MATRLLSLITALILFQVTVFGVGSKHAKYIGGTLEHIKADTEFNDVSTFGDSFSISRKNKKKGSIEIPYADIKSLEYGQKVGRRIGQAIVLGIFTMGIGGLLALAKKRRHYLSITYSNGDATEAVVVELGKKITRQTLKVLEVRSGVEIEFESEEAKKNLR